jgi:hypothetical protein
MIVIRQKLENDIPVFIIGYGASGAGKTSSLIYFRNAESEVDKNGILINICNLFGNKKTFDKIELNCKEFYHTTKQIEKPNLTQTDILDEQVVIVETPYEPGSKIDFTYNDSKNTFILGSGSEVKTGNTPLPVNYYEPSNLGEKWTYTVECRCEITKNSNKIKPSNKNDESFIKIKEQYKKSKKIHVYGIRSNPKYKIQSVDDDGITLEEKSKNLITTNAVNTTLVFEIETDYTDEKNLIENTKNEGYLHKTHHEYRMIDRKLDKVSKYVHFPNGCLLGEVIIHLIDTDRFVKATTNNPNSSRSHTLVFVKLQNSQTNKKANIIIGDFAGVENAFNCEDDETRNKFLSVKRDLSDNPYYSTEAIGDNTDPINGGNNIADCKKYISVSDPIFDFDNPVIRKGIKINKYLG